MHRFAGIALAFILLTSTRVAASAPLPDSLHLLPENIKLSGPGARQQVIVERQRDGQASGQETNSLVFVSSDPAVVRMERDIVVPVGNGSASIVVRHGGTEARATVTVEKMDQPFSFSFRNHVQPVLARTGCSSGACHGAAAGQNGFKLSLRGYDDEGDYLALTRQALGRRILPADPARSLMLLKPTGIVPHKGGKRFEADSPEYEILSRWIANGVPGPGPDDPRITRIEFLPEQAILKPGDNQQLLVRAHFNDGHSEDVTRWAKFNAANAAVTQVDDNGNVKVIGYGEGGITAWYLSRIAVATVTVPFTNSVSAEVFTKAGRRNFIDDLVLDKLAKLNLPPSPRCTDAEFIRRAYLDTTGMLPAIGETKKFLENSSTTKRDALIESLLQGEAFVDYWTYKWSDLLLVSSKKLKPAAMWSYYHWIRRNVAENVPWDKMVRQIITAQGSTLQNGAGNFYLLHEDPRALTETTSLAFLGMSINCARCHNHPMEKWTNDEYYGMANLFARVRAKNGANESDSIIFVSSEGDLVQPVRGKPQSPRPLEGKALPMNSPADRRAALADWLVSPENPYFAKAIINRLWKNYFGVGLVENVDDLRVTNPPSNQKLLDQAAQFLAKNNFDLKAFMRTILQSETYQRSSTALPENADDRRFYSHYYPRRLMAEVLLDSMSAAADSPTKFPNYPEKWRAVQLPDANVDSYFLKAFGRPERNVTCDCERTAEPSVTQVLHISNGDTLNKKLSATDNRIGQWIARNATPEEVVEEAYLAALSRHPTGREKEKMISLLENAPPAEKRPVLEDLMWALLSSNEFLFNH